MLLLLITRVFFGKSTKIPLAVQTANDGRNRKIQTTVERREGVVFPSLIPFLSGFLSLLLLLNTTNLKLLQTFVLSYYSLGSYSPFAVQTDLSSSRIPFSPSQPPRNSLPTPLHSILIAPNNFHYISHFTNHIQLYVPATARKTGLRMDWMLE